MIEVKRINDQMIFIKLVVGSHIMNVVSAYVPQVILYEEFKKTLLERFG